MNQLKIGKFIATQRKAKGLTQAQLAEKLLITDRAVSKWETGKSMPDSSIMLELCELLDITVNELLTGEKIDMTDYNKTAELNLLNLKKQKEKSDKMLLDIEIVLGVTCIISALAIILVGSYLCDENNVLYGCLLIALGTISVFVISTVCIVIEAKAGYYKCPHCGHEYQPSVKSTLLAMHINRTRKLKCPHCQKKGWSKKIITKTEEK